MQLASKILRKETKCTCFFVYFLFICLFKKEKRKAAYLLDCKTLHQALLKAEAFRDNDHRTVKGVNELEVYKYCSLLCYKYFTRFLSFLTCKEELE